MSVHRYLLDTNILSSLLKQPAGAVASRIRSVGEDTICTSIIVTCELRYGAAKKGSPTLSGKVEQLLASAASNSALFIPADDRRESNIPPVQ